MLYLYVCMNSAILIVYLLTYFEFWIKDWLNQMINLIGEGVLVTLSFVWFIVFYLLFSCTFSFM